MLTKSNRKKKRKRSISDVTTSNSTHTRNRETNMANTEQFKKGSFHSEVHETEFRSLYDNANRI